MFNLCDFSPGGENIKAILKRFLKTTNATTTAIIGFTSTKIKAVEHTVVNECKNDYSNKFPIDAKVQCMRSDHPAFYWMKHTVNSNVKIVIKKKRILTRFVMIVMMIKVSRTKFRAKELT